MLDGFQDAETGLRNPPVRSYLAGVQEVRDALQASAPVQVLLVAALDRSPDILELLALAEARSVRIWRGGDGDLRRMSRTQPPPRCLAMLGPDPQADLGQVLERGGISWLLHRVSYASNVGFAVRTAEVSGASGVLIDASLNHEERGRVSHVSMGADRLLPVLYEDSTRVLAAARSRGVSVVAIEDVGTRAPWQVDLRGPVICVIGGERDGIPSTLLAACDAIVRLPMAGFVPSYNLQGAMAAVAVERLRQLNP